jgi:aspartate/methionine/tyrosine aminotransferase
VFGLAPEEAIFCLANVLLGPGDHAVVTWPGYQSLYEVARATGADVSLHELREEAACAIDIDALRRQVTVRDAADRRQRPTQPDR